MKNIINKIKQNHFNYDGFKMVLIPDYKSFYLGIDSNENIVFMIKPNNQKEPVAYVSSRGKYLDVLFDMECEINTNGCIINDSFTILTLKTNNDFFVKIFYSICFDLIEMLGDCPDKSKIIKHVEVFRDLFGKTLKKTSITEIGLWGELLVIESSDDLPLLIDSWHKLAKQTFDFNDGLTKLEVKTTTLNERIHSFSLNQLKKSKETTSLICSIMTSQIDLGKSVSDLFEKINSKITPEYRLKLKEKIMDVAGSDLEIFTNKFDYNTAVLAMKIFEPEKIPSIKSINIPNEISEVRFKVNLEDIDTYTRISNIPNLIKNINHL